MAGILLTAAGLICNHWLPINKKLWTSSFSLFMAGLDFVMFGLFSLAGRWPRLPTRGQAAGNMGKNAIVVYLASEFLDEAFGWIHWTSEGHTISLHRWLFENLFAGLLSPINASLLYGIAYTLVIYLFAYGMYRRGWFVKV